MGLKLALGPENLDWTIPRLGLVAKRPQNDDA